MLGTRSSKRVEQRNNSEVMVASEGGDGGRTRTQVARVGRESQEQIVIKKRRYRTEPTFSFGTI